MHDATPFMCAFLGCIVIFEALAVLALAGQLRRAHLRDACWAVTAETWRQNSEDWRGLAEKFGYPDYDVEAG